MTLEQGCTDESARTPSDDEASFAADLAELGNQALRTRYRREATSHAAMKRRCRDGAFELDPAWENFRDFLQDMGPQTTSDATLDRIDPEVRRYGPGLCRWATKTEQTTNRSNTVWVNYRGERMRLKEFADKIAVKYSTVHGAISRGEAPEAIAARYEAATDLPSDYRPAWITEDDKFNRWRADYVLWRRRVRRDRRELAHPEVYAAILASEALHASAKFLDGKGVAEMTPDEHAEAMERWPDHFRCSADGVAWIKHALRSLLSKDRSLTARLAPRGVEWVDLRLFEEALIPPPDD